MKDWMSIRNQYNFSVYLPKYFPSCPEALADQLKRAALSVPLNIAEASGRTGSLDNAKHFAIARGSALECGAILDACFTLQILENKIFDEAKRLIVAIVSMLSKLCMKR